MLKEIELSFDEPERLRLVTKALGSEVRLRIMEMLDERSMNIEELSQCLGVPISTVSNNVIELEKADLISTERQNGVRGVMKVCSRKRDTVTIRLHKPRKRELRSHFQHMPVGCYTDCRVEPVCGMAGMRSYIGQADDPNAFYDPSRFQAQLLWFQRGYVEYRFSNHMLRGGAPASLELSFEASSEAPNFRRDWPSDITVWINGVELGTWQCPGDFGGRQGRNSPDWWPVSMSQFGLLKRWRVDGQGCMLDDMQISDVTIAQLKLDEAPYITVRIGIREDAEHQGGINLFGEGFGDYNRPIVLRLDSLDDADG